MPLHRGLERHIFFGQILERFFIICNLCINEFRKYSYNLELILQNKILEARRMENSIVSTRRIGQIFFETF